LKCKRESREGENADSHIFAFWVLVPISDPVLEAKHLSRTAINRDTNTNWDLLHKYGANIECSNQLGSRSLTAKLLVPQGLDSCWLITICKFFQKTWRYIDAYQ
jgi:hypothetical protein